MTHQTLLAIEHWFNNYIKAYTSENQQEQRNYDLKIEHTYRVKEAMQEITSALGLAANEQRLALTMALLHDTGRFPQYKRYKTFKDSSSENHAALSVTELQNHGVLETLTEQERKLILSAILHHNKAELPSHLSATERYYTQLLRDADKVDILYTVTNYYEKKHEIQNKTIELDLDDGQDITDHILSTFLQGKVILMDELREANDFKLLQLAWINDINFAPSLQLIIEGNYLWKIVETLPQGEKREQVSTYLQNMIDERTKVLDRPKDNKS